MYHIVDSIKSFGAINGFTTKTYESLHKEYVKIPYRLSNKKCIEFLLIDIHTFIAKFNSEPNIDDNMKIGFSKFLNCLDLYLDQQIDIADINKSNISIYGSVTLENGAIIRATSSFHGKPWFS